MQKHEVKQKIEQLQKSGKEAIHKRIIMRVCEIKYSGQLFVTVPKNSGIKKDDFVELKKIE